jgi:hypothetical protein
MRVAPCRENFVVNRQRQCMVLSASNILERDLGLDLAGLENLVADHFLHRHFLRQCLVLGIAEPELAEDALAKGENLAVLGENHGVIAARFDFGDALFESHRLRLLRIVNLASAQLAEATSSPTIELTFTDSQTVVAARFYESDWPNHADLSRLGVHTLEADLAEVKLLVRTAAPRPQRSIRFKSHRVKEAAGNLGDFQSL